MDRLIVGCEEGAGGRERIPTDVTSVSGLARRLNLSRTQLGRKFAEAEALGSLGWSGARGRSPLWVSAGFRREYHSAQAVKLAIIDAAFEACTAHGRHAAVSRLSHSAPAACTILHGETADGLGSRCVSILHARDSAARPAEANEEAGAG